jgi:hypothetical protein
MISVMLRVLAIAGALGAIAAGCAKPPEEPLQLDGGRLTVQNASADDWVDVEIWLNQHYRVTWPRLEAGGRLIVPLDTFVAGFGQRFNFSRQQVTALRLEAKNTDGAPVEIHKKFQKGGLAGALEGMR